MIAALLQEHFEQSIDDEKWEASGKREEAARKRLKEMSITWQDPAE